MLEWRTSQVADFLPLFLFCTTHKRGTWLVVTAYSAYVSFSKDMCEIVGRFCGDRYRWDLRAVKKQSSGISRRPAIHEERRNTTQKERSRDRSSRGISLSRRPSRRLESAKWLQTSEKSWSPRTINKVCLWEGWDTCLPCACFTSTCCVKPRTETAANVYFSSCVRKPRRHKHDMKIKLCATGGTCTGPSGFGA